MNRINKGEIPKLILCIVACQGAGLLGSIFTNMSVSTWYPTLAKPWFTPPPGVIPAVWTVLFTLMGVSLFLAWRAGLTSPEFRGAAYAFAAQFVFNILWSAAFFGLQSPKAGLAVIAMLWILILLTIYRFYPLSREAALLLVPYIAWVSFAAILNYSILQLNP
ncbi:MAG: TspO/MBR family protein [Methanothrix sp.]|jgi:translocator protein|nr:tryptophan-rich sensory protein [Methanothrix sp.]MDD1733907.1 tryptophan-rich sensory protein [Methanothrix sp.]MDD1737423.1 tryptophan-rich sensory protein [Methanothrix sp.]NTV76805.1 tryptophan-rich sensory protein [Methanothrix sp.]OYV08819.1 MAG: tryptophan-rich sensory protein [Methanosaeta sp. NSP1]